MHITKRVLIVASMAVAAMGLYNLPWFVLAAEQFRQAGPVERSTDVAWLERMVLSPEGDPSLVKDQLASGAKDFRTAAYARLGEMATPESLAAVRRIDAALTKQTNLTPDGAAPGTWLHPAWHFSDSEARPVAQAVADDGRRFAIVVGSMLGGTDFYLMWSRTPNDRGARSRPLLLPARWYSGGVAYGLTWQAKDRLVLSFTQKEAPPPAIMDGMPERQPAPAVGPVTYRFEIAEILRDTDGDGWTDVEEARLGLDAKNKDTDGDGVPDGRDSCPNFAPAKPATEEQEIIKRALFAVYSVGGARSALLVGSGTTPVQVDGYNGPILYRVDRQDWLNRYGHGGVFVNWTVKQRGENLAVVDITDWEGMLAGGGQEVRLRKIDGTWIVISRQTTWVS